MLSPKNSLSKVLPEIDDDEEYSELLERAGKVGESIRHGVSEGVDLFSDALEEDFRNADQGGRGVGRREKTVPLDVLITLGLIVLIAALAVLTVIRGLGSLQQSYASAKDETARRVSERYREAIYDAVEDHWHTSNRATISLGNIREESELEVLMVDDVDYVIDPKTDDGIPVISWFQDLVDGEGDTGMWLRVPGKGTFTVNLKAGEYIIDEARQTVTIRLSEPVLKNFGVDYANIALLHYEDGSRTTESGGISQLRDNLRESEGRLRSNTVGNQYYYKRAEESARNMITTMVKQLNPDRPDLKVVVEFV